MKLSLIKTHMCGFYGLALFVLTLSFVFLACEKDRNPNDDDPQKSKVDIPTQLAKVSFVGEIEETELVDLEAGVELWKIKVLTAAAQPVAFSIIAIDLNQPHLALHTITPNDEDEYLLQTVREMALAADGPGHRVIAAVNADYFYWTGEPWGPVVKRGKLIRDQFFDDWHGFFGIDQAGGLYMGSSVNFVGVKDQLVEAVGGTERLINRGGRMHHQNSERHPRTVIGYSADNIVYLMVVDGRQPGHSIGMQLAELSEVMWALGVSEALNLDGGGSSTLVLRNQTGDTFEIGNGLVDDAERAVANGLAVVRVSGD